MSSAQTRWIARLDALFLIAIGGFAGATIRFLALSSLPEVAAIVLVNTAGSTILAFLLYTARGAGGLDRTTRLLIATGFLSSLTTYSTFALQTALADSPGELLAVIAGNYVLAVLGAVVGRAVALRLRGGRS